MGIAILKATLDWSRTILLMNFFRCRLKPLMGIAILKATLTRSFLTLLTNLLTNFFGTLEATHGRRDSEAILTLSHLALLTDEFRKAFLLPWCWTMKGPIAKTLANYFGAFRRRLYLEPDDEGPHRLLGARR